VLVPEVEAPLNIGVFVYGVILTTMLWRSVARAESFDQFTTSWSKFFSCVGGVLFVISDSFLGFNHFYTPLPYSQVIVANYIAALAIRILRIHILILNTYNSLNLFVIQI